MQQEFQFHIGMINPYSNNNIKYYDTKFQFHIGMINPRTIEKKCIFNNDISIPHWYD